MSETAIVLICDENYVVPTLGTALSARMNISDPEVRVIIYVVGISPSWSASFKDSLMVRNIEVEWIVLPMLSELRNHHRDRYLPPITLARFWLAEILPKGITQFLYIDGDIMVDKSLDNFLQMPPPEGIIIAAPDNLQMFLGEWSKSGKKDLEYMASISVGKNDYFNSGVIFTLRDTWVEFSYRAMEFMKNHSDLCRSSDQSALNHAAAGKVHIIPQRYNFQSEHMMIAGNKNISPSPIIYHFTGGPKPWIRADWPWSEYFNRYYRIAESICKDFNLGPGEPPVDQTLAGVAHRRRFQIRQKWVYPWRRFCRRQKLKRLL